MELFMVLFVYVFHSGNSVAVSLTRRAMKSLLLVEIEAYQYSYLHTAT
jgi:hypothetical protein